MCKNRGIYGFLSPSWVLIAYNICPPVNSGEDFDVFLDENLIRTLPSTASCSEQRIQGHSQHLSSPAYTTPGTRVYIRASSLLPRETSKQWKHIPRTAYQKPTLPTLRVYPIVKSLGSCVLPLLSNKLGIALSNVLTARTCDVLSAIL